MIGACQLVAAHRSGHVTPRGDALQAAHAAPSAQIKYTHIMNALVIGGASRRSMASGPCRGPQDPLDPSGCVAQPRSSIRSVALRDLSVQRRACTAFSLLPAWGLRCE